MLLPLGGHHGHRTYKLRGPNRYGAIHKWVARVVVTLGFINGGLGLDLSGQEKKYIYAYSVVGGVLILTWWAFAVKSELKPKNSVTYTDKAQGGESSS